MSLGSPFQSLEILSVEKFSLVSKLDLPWHSLKPFFLVLLLVAWEKRSSLPGYHLLPGNFREQKGLKNQILVEISKVLKYFLLQNADKSSSLKTEKPQTFFFIFPSPVFFQSTVVGS